VFAFFRFLKLKKIVCALAFSIKGIGRPATVLQHYVVPPGFSFGELIQKKIL
jgi:hypothetical protein